MTQRGNGFEPVLAQHGQCPSRKEKLDREGPTVLVRVRGLKKFYSQRSFLGRSIGSPVKAVDGVDLDIHRGETIGLIGESGSGKSTLGRVILNLLEPTAGSVEFEGVTLSSLDRSALSKLRRRMQMIFQDPFASLNPRMTAGRIISEPLEIHRLGTPAERSHRVKELLTQVGLSSDAADRYPHQFSGGQRQRIGIARALATNPSFIVADEPISALDVSIQAQVVNLLSDIGKEFGLTYLLIAHDLSMVRHLCDRVAVMYLGKIVEMGPSESVFSEPLHPYTKLLTRSIPQLPGNAPSDDFELPGSESVDADRPSSGCSFQARCTSATELCVKRPQLKSIRPGDSNHVASCHHPSLKT